MTKDKHEFTQANMDELSFAVKGALYTVGGAGAKYMRDITAKNEKTGNLTDSIKWTTMDKSGNKGSRATEKDVIDKPTDPYTVSIGSAAEHARYREYGSGYHSNKEGSDIFIKRLNEWTKMVWGVDKDDPKTAWEFWSLVKHIRDTGTESEPFAKPTKAYLDILAPNVVRRAIMKFIRTGKK